MAMELEQYVPAMIADSDDDLPVDNADELASVDNNANFERIRSTGNQHRARERSARI